MRGDDVQQGGMLSYVSLEARVPSNHPQRDIKAPLDEAFAATHDGPIHGPEVVSV